MAKTQVARLDLVAIVGIPHHQIGVETRDETPLAIAEAGQARRRRAHPGRQRRQAEPASARRRPDRGQPQLQRGDPSPCLVEIAAFGQLEVRRAGAVVGHDQIDDPGGQPRPQRLSVRVATNRRRALEARRPLGDRFGLETEVVRAGLDGERQALGLGLAHRIE